MVSRLLRGGQLPPTPPGQPASMMEVSLSELQAAADAAAAAPAPLAAHLKSNGRAVRVDPGFSQLTPRWLRTLAFRHFQGLSALETKIR